MIIGLRNFNFEGYEPSAFVMGVLNVTPDSFSDGGRFADPQAALEHALQMEAVGADLIDLGAESTRPGSSPVSDDEEIRRLLPVLKTLIPRLKTPISIDTQKSAVAEMALGEGASMINDVSALRDPKMAGVVARHQVPIVLMHMKGVPATMQDQPGYENVLREVSSFLESKIRDAVAEGIDREKIFIDPGFGFGKRFEDNLTLLSLLGELGALRAPIVVGLSKKSFIRKLFGSDEGSLVAGSTAAAALAVKSGASIIRAHDVATTKAAIRLALGVQVS